MGTEPTSGLCGRFLGHINGVPVYCDQPNDHPPGMHSVRAGEMRDIPAPTLPPIVAERDWNIVRRLARDARNDASRVDPVPAVDLSRSYPDANPLTRRSLPGASLPSDPDHER